MQSDSYLDSEEQERELRADVHIECCGKPPRGATASPYGTPPSAACHEFQVESTQTEHGIGAKRLQMALKGFWKNIKLNFNFKFFRNCSEIFQHIFQTCNLFPPIGMQLLTNTTGTHPPDGQVGAHASTQS
jgi:hypothetical protein